VSVGFGFVQVFDFDRRTVAELIGRFRAQSFTSASRPRERIDYAEPLNGIEARHVLGIQDLHANLQARRQNHGIPKGNGMQHVQPLSALKHSFRRKHQAEHSKKFREPAPCV
jgi:hypothetical protein